MLDSKISILNINYAIKVASHYVNDMKHIETCFIKFRSFRSVFILAYKVFLIEGLQPIESLDEEVKKDIFNTSIEWEPKVIPTETRIALCRCIWALNYVLEKYLKV